MAKNSLGTPLLRGQNVSDQTRGLEEQIVTSEIANSIEVSYMYFR